jgi:NAD+ diphosphatase
MYCNKPCETIQEAVGREVWEESGVEIETVFIVDSQPWPLARSGGCELMIGKNDVEFAHVSQ